MITDFEQQCKVLEEVALLGPFLYGDFEVTPDASFTRYVPALLQTYEQFDFSHIVRHFQKHIISTQDPTEYYRILKELAKLTRNEFGGSSSGMTELSKSVGR